MSLRPLWIWAALLTAVALAFVIQPKIGLLRLLGYEFALAFAILGSIATIQVGGALVVRTREGIRHDLDRPSFAGDGLAVQLALTVLGGWLLVLGPALVGLAGAVFVTNCDLAKGIGLYLALPAVSVQFAAVAGVTAGLVAPKRFPRLFVGVIAFVVVGVSMLWELGRFYTTPIVFFYDAFGGYASGQGWDRAMSLGDAYWWYRLFNLSVCAALVAALWIFLDDSRLRLGRPRWRRWPSAILVAAASGLAIFLYGARGELGFRPTASFAARELGGLIETEHLRIHYDRRVLEEDAPLIAADLEYRYDSLADFFGRAPAGRITVWLYGAAETKKRLFGTAHTDMAKPWRREIHLGPSPFPHNVAMHEMAHVFAGEMAGGPFNVPSDLLFHVSMGLVEGIAMAAEWHADAVHNEFTLHEWAAAMRRGGFAPRVERIISAEGFLASYPRTSYFIAGSFVRFLVDQYGIDTFAAAYGGSTFSSVYGKDLSALATEWGAFIDAAPIPGAVVDMAKFRFDRPSILRAVCYRSIGELKAAAKRHRIGGRWDEALVIYRRVCAYEPDQPAHIMAELRTLFDARRFADARRKAEEVLTHPKLSAVNRLEVDELLADLDWNEKKLAAAREGYARTASTHRAEPTARRLAIKLAALDAESPSVRAGLREYFFPPRHQKPTVVLLLLREMLEADPDSAALSYLLGFRLAGLGEWERAVPYLRRALELRLPHPAVTRKALWRLGEALFRLGELADAERVYRTLDAEDQPLAVRITARDWLQRIAWWRANPGRACALGSEGCGRRPTS